MKQKELRPAVFIETEPLRSASEDVFTKSFILKTDEIYFTCDPQIKFEDIKNQLITMAKKYLDEALLLTAEEYDILYQKRLKEMMKDWK